MDYLRKAFSLIELLIVIVIISILATMAISQFGKTAEVSRAQEAESALEQILTGEKIYRTEEGCYYPAGMSESSIATINQNLKLFLDIRDSRAWDYSVTAVANPPGDTFTATATRRSGRNMNETIIIDQDGTYSGTWTP